MSRAVSIRDIAIAAKVSHTTVSRALRKSKMISPDVRERIRDLADEMGYTPNAVAQSLQGKRTNTVGLVVTSIADPFVGRVVRGIDEVAMSAGISVFLGASYNDPDRAISIIETFHRRRVDGIIVASAQIIPQYTQRLASINVPTVLINQQAETQFTLFNSVDVDDYGGARMAVEHLIGLGHHAIGYLGAENRPRSNRRRLEGYRDALIAAGIQPQEVWMRFSPAEHRFHTDDVTDGQYLAADLIDSKVTAIFCYNDMIAVGVLSACCERGIGVPNQISLVGFDDIELAQYVTPALTTVHQPKLRLGQLAMKMMVDILGGKQVENHVVTTELIRRASTATMHSHQHVQEVSETGENPELLLKEVV